MVHAFIDFIQTNYNLDFYFVYPPHLCRGQFKVTNISATVHVSSFILNMCAPQYWAV